MIKDKLDSQAVVTLREINSETVRTICSLNVTQEQKRFVAPNALSIAQAYFEPKAWFRAIYADETPVGFVMLYDDRDTPKYFTWRFMIDMRYQKLGYGRQAMQLLIDEVRGRPGAAELFVSYVDEDGGPGPFYRKLGFEPTGDIEHDEVVARLVL